MVYCNVCRKPISEKVYVFSMKEFDRALCIYHQRNQGSSTRDKPKSTPETKRLGEALKRKGWKVEFEKFDGFKHIDIAITEAKTNIEVDGAHHNFSKKQALSDLKRTFHSFKKDFVTLRIPNSLVKDQYILEETANFISRFLNESKEQIEEDDDWDY